MSNERIDLTEFEDLQHSWRTRSGIYDELFSQWIGDRKEEIMAELKRCYEELDLAHRNLSIVRNALARGYPDIEEEIWELIDASD
jgi:uncharacterized protein with HEPN domain|tara:strand:- start:378 stop:632 length:255 start_codon:yes stop_codon:yes gene_type:complete